MAGNAVSKWLVSRIIDAWGNPILFSYGQDMATGEAWPVSIDYAGSSVHFIFEKRKDKITKYANGSPNTQSLILKKIKTLTDNVSFREYEFNYFINTDDMFSKLTEISLKGTDGSKYNTTKILWNSKTTSNPVMTTSGAFREDLQVVRTGDFNGDGKSDFFVIDRLTALWSIFTSTGVDFVQSFSGQLTISASNGEGIYGGEYKRFYDQNRYLVNFEDFDNDGKSDIVILKKIKYSFGTYYYNVIALFSHENFMTEHLVASGSTYNRSFGIRFGDFNGDGKSELLLFPEQDIYSSTSLFFYSYNSTSNNLIIQNGATQSVVASTIECMDFNGDGITDIFLLDESPYNQGNTYKVIQFAENSWSSVIELMSPTTWEWESMYIRLGDFNNDGKTDLLLSVDNTVNNSSILYSNGNSFIADLLRFNVVYSDNTTTTVDETIYATIDINQDGYTDLFLRRDDGNNYICYGPAYFDIVPDGITYNAQLIGSVDFNGQGSDNFGDFNGDGMIDMPIWDPNPNLGYLSLFTNNKSLNVSQIKNGFNKSTEFNYSTLADGSLHDDNTPVYTKDYTSVYPLQTIQPPFNVVNEIKTTNGDASGNLSTTFTYKNLVANNYGLGLLGFTETLSSSPKQKTDNINEVLNTSVCLIRPLTSVITTASNQPLSSKSFTYSLDATTFGNKIYFQYASDVSESNFEHGSITHHYVYDANGNITTDNTGFSGGDAVNTSYSNYGISGAWCASKPGTVTTVKTVGSDPYTLTSTYTYSNGSVLRKEANSVVINNTYNSFGNITKTEISGSGTITEEYTYDSKGRFVLSKTNALGTTKFDYYNPFGLVNQITDINNLITTISYDGFGRPNRKNLPDGNSVDYEIAFYSSNPAEYYVWEKPSNHQPSVKTRYNMFGKPLGTETDGPNGTIITEIVYNTLGQVTDKYMPYISSRGDKWHYNTYDGYGRVLTESTPDEDNIGYTYTGLQTAITSAKGNISTTVNHFNQPLSVTENGITTSYTYFGHGGVNTINAAGSQITCGYDPATGYQTSLDDPNVGSTTYQYNVFGQLMSQVQPGSTPGSYITTSFQYDLAERPIIKTIGGITYNYTYDNEFKGSLSSVSSSDGKSINYHYNSFGDLLSKTVIANGQNLVTKYEYDNHKVITKTYPSILNDNFAINYSYDNFGYLKEIDNKANSNLIWKANSYDAMMQVTEYLSGKNITDNTFLHNYLTNTKTMAGNTVLQNMDFSWYSGSGLLHTRTDWRAYTETFGYDTKQRCTSTVLTDETNTVLSNLTTSYADNGNITGKSDVGAYGYEGSQPHAITKITPTGNISHTQQDLTFNELNKVATITEGDYSMDINYGINTNRDKVTQYNNNAVQFTKFYADDYEVTAFAGGASREFNYISTPSGLSAIYVKNRVSSTASSTDTLYYIFNDHLGSISTIANNRNSNLQHLGYNTWGKREITGGDYTSYLFDRGFTGHEHLDAFNLINMNGRVYDPVLGRFLSPDNNVQGASSKYFNRYSYCLNNPIKYTDPNGWEYDDGDDYGDWDPVDDDPGQSTTYYAAPDPKIIGYEYHLGGYFANRDEGYDKSDDYRDIPNHYNESSIADAKFITRECGGFIYNYNDFISFMKSQAANNPVEVAALGIKDPNTGNIIYFVQPWADNTVSNSVNNLYGVPGFSIRNVINQYHTHPHSTGPSRMDALFSKGWNIPVYTIGANGNEWCVHYPDYYAVPKYPSGWPYGTLINP